MRKNIKLGFIQDSTTINAIYVELIQLNFNLDVVDPLDLGEVHSYLHPMVIRKLSERLNSIYAVHAPTLNIELEKTRVQHIIEQLKATPRSMLTHFYSYVTIFFFIISLVSQPLLEYALNLYKPSFYISFGIISVTFVILVAIFLSSFVPATTSETEQEFRIGFKLLFYHLYYKLLNN